MATTTAPQTGQQLALAAITGFEGSIAWMYLDTDAPANVTVGVGNLLTMEAAGSLPFLINGVIASRAQVGADFARVAAMPGGHSAAFYRVPGCCELGGGSIQALLRQRIVQFGFDLSQRLPEFNTYPPPAQAALYDMIYNLGAGGLFGGYPHMIASVEARDWLAVAGNCHRRGPSQARNDWTSAQFKLAATEGTNAD